MRGWQSRAVVAAMALVVGLALHGAPPFARAQVPDTFKNLEVLPKDISRGELVSVMRSYASGLGVRCSHCHVGAEAPQLKGANFAADDKEAKRTARLMMKMVREINGGHISKLGPKHTTRVECVTCHRGLASPKTLADELKDVLASQGREAAVARYRELRVSSYGRGGYDFGQGTLNGLGEQLLSDKKPEDALSLLTLNREFFPEAAWTRYLLGEAHRALGQRKEAMAEYEKSAALEPQNPMARQRLQEMAASPSPVP